MQVTMMFCALQGSHQFDVTGVLEPRLPSTRINVTRVVICHRMKQKRKVRIFFSEICQEVSIELTTKYYNYGFDCIVVVSVILIVVVTYLMN